MLLENKLQMTYELVNTVCVLSLPLLVNSLNISCHEYVVGTLKQLVQWKSERVFNWWVWLIDWLIKLKTHSDLYCTSTRSLQDIY